MLFIWSTDSSYLASKKMATTGLKVLLFVKLTLTLIVQTMKEKVLLFYSLLNIIDRLDALFHLMYNPSGSQRVRSD